MIPDDEPWWMVRRSMTAAIGDAMPGDSTLADKVCQGPVPNGIADEPASETLNHLDSLDFRPIGYEW